MLRPSLDAYFMLIARAAATRSTCPHHQVGTVLVADGHIVSSGYNGVARGLEHCPDDGSCKDQFGKCLNCAHSEINAIVQASRQCDTVYITLDPCLSCLHVLLAHNPRIRIVAWQPHYSETVEAFIARHGVGAVERLTLEDEDTMLSLMPRTPTHDLAAAIEALAMPETTDIAAYRAAADIRRAAAALV